MVIVIASASKANPLGAAAFEKVVGPSRTAASVISFDIGRDLTDTNAFIATEVFEDAAARERQESLPEVANVMPLLPTSRRASRGNHLPRLVV